VLGPRYSNVCPAGSVRIETEAACRTAVAAAGKRIDSSFVVTDSGYPRGCFNTGCDPVDPSCNYAYFNAHPLGAVPTSYGQRLLCAAVTTGAPPRACARVDARVYTGASRTVGRCRMRCRVLYGTTQYSRGTAPHSAGTLRVSVLAP
jgi:hypothetical protein